MLSRIVLALITIAGVVAGSGCSSAGADSADAVVVAVCPLEYAARQLLGRDAEIVNLTPAGAEPHDLELSAGDVRRVRDARLVVFIGRGFQPALEQALDERSGPSLDVLQGPEVDRDPHLWLDPVRYAEAVRALARALGEPAAADDLVGRLERLDGELRRGLASCARRDLVTSHAAFGAFAARYGLEQIALTGLAPDAEPTPGKLDALVAEIERRGVTTVFSETLVDPGLAETVAREAGVATALLDPLEGLSDEQQGRGADYFTVMRENLAAVREALACR